MAHAMSSGLGFGKYLVSGKMAQSHPPHTHRLPVASPYLFHHPVQPKTRQRI
jgi:hypothetical protein